MRNNSIELAYYTKFLTFVILQLLIFGIADAAKMSMCLLPRREQRNANQISDDYIDVVTPDKSIKHYKTGDFLPLSCFSHRKNCISNSEFQMENDSILEKLLDLRLNALPKIDPALMKEFSQAKNKIFKTHSLNQNDQKKLLTIFTNLYTYRLLMERALAAKKVSHINCGEHAFIAAMEELLRFHQNDYPSNFSRKIQAITLQSTRYPESNHIFLVIGDTALKDLEKTTHKPTVRKILTKLNGIIIDHWNNPSAGGVRLPASEAREKFRLYNPKIADTYDIIFVISYPTLFPHVEIEKANIPEKLKQILMELSGPSIEELQSVFFQSAEEERPRFQ